MKAIVYHGPGHKAWEDVPDPVVVDDTDAIIRVDAVTICGTDLHILKGDVPTCQPGTTLGHEGVGVIDSVGPGVTSFKPGHKYSSSSATASRAPVRRNQSSTMSSMSGYDLMPMVDSY